MRERFQKGRRVRVVRAEELCDAPVGAFATVDYYARPNFDGTDWEIHLTPEIPEPPGSEPFWLLDEGSLVSADGDNSLPHLDDDHPRDAHGRRLDCVYTHWTVTGTDQVGPTARVASLLKPIIGGSPQSTRFTEYPLRSEPKVLVGLSTTWSGCKPMREIFEDLRDRFPDSNGVNDDGWSLDLWLRPEDATALLGPDTVDFALEIVPWSSFVRRPPSDRYDGSRSAG